MPVSDIRVYAGATDGWVSLKGSPGPTVVSANAGNLCKLGTDGFLLVAKADLDALFVNTTGDTMTGTLQVRAPSGTNSSLSLIGESAFSSFIFETYGTGVFPAINFRRFRGTVAAPAQVGASDPIGAVQGLTYNAANAVATVSQIVMRAVAAPVVGEAGVKTRIDFVVHSGTALLTPFQVTDAGVSIAGNITSTGTAHNFAANSITASAIAGLPAASTVAPLANAAAAVIGVSAAYARADHVHPFPNAAQVGALTQAQGDARYVELAGDWMSGPLRLGGTATFVGTAPLDIDANTYRLRQSQTPASQTATGEPGTMCWDTAYLYCCVAQNQWRRLAWTDWSGTPTGLAWSPLAASLAPRAFISYCGGFFFADSAKFSSDGANWFQGTSFLPVTSSTGITRAVYGLGTFVRGSLGTTGTFQSPATAIAIYTSSDGKAWVPRSAAMAPYNNGASSRSIAFGAGRFVFLPYSYDATNGRRLQPRHSADGITWSAGAVSGAAALDSVEGLAHSGSLFVAVGSNTAAATNSYLTSPDGVTWTARALPVSAVWQDVSFGNGRFVAVTTGRVALTSVDGINWTQVNMPSSADWETLTFGGGKWLAVALNTSTAAISSDGVTWTTIPLPTASSWNGIATNGTVFVATNNTDSPAILTPTPQLVTYFPITASRTLVAGDANATVANTSTGAAPVTITIPGNATLAYPIGTSITIMDASQSAVTTIKASAGVTLNWSGKLVGTSATVLGGVAAEVQIPGPLSQVVLRKTAADSWSILY